MDEALKSSGGPVPPPAAAAKGARAGAAAGGALQGRGRGRRRLGWRILESPAVQARRRLATGYLRLVSRTSRFSRPPTPIRATPIWRRSSSRCGTASTSCCPSPASSSSTSASSSPATATANQRPRRREARHRTIRGSTARDPSRMIERSGMVGFLEMKAALEEGRLRVDDRRHLHLAARRAGMGIVSLARVSGRPIIRSPSPRAGAST